MATTPILWDRDTDTNITASRLLDDHHKFVGVSAFGDDIPDHCDVCGFAVGFYSLPPDEILPGGAHDDSGHATSSDLVEVQEWIASH